MKKSKIEWTDATWNPCVGCKKVSAGCAHCYALDRAKRIAGTTSNSASIRYADALNDAGDDWSGKWIAEPSLLSAPLHWRKPRRAFVCSMSDIFLRTMDKDYVAAMFGVMALAGDHTFQILTKRPAQGRMFYNWLESPKRKRNKAFSHFPAALATCLTAAGKYSANPYKRRTDAGPISPYWPPRNVWMGTTVENQAAADTRIGYLLGIPAALHFLSVEPLIGPIDFSSLPIIPNPIGTKIDWIVAGGESGPGARPTNPAWARSIRDQAADNGVPFLWKQWGTWLPENQLSQTGISPGTRYVVMTGEDHGGAGYFRAGKKAAGRLLDGCIYDEFPQVA